MTLTPGFASTTYPEFFKVYIDYNNDKILLMQESLFIPQQEHVMVTHLLQFPQRRMEVHE